MAVAGRILIMPKGAYDANKTYEMLDLVNYNGIAWLAKKTCNGITPSDDSTDYWQNMLKLNIVNNLEATDAGGVLDARQGKILADMIKASHETRHVIITPQNSTSHENYNGCYYSVSGNCVHVHIGIAGLVENGARVLICTLPEEIRPVRLVSSLGLSDSELNTFALGYIQPDGRVEVRSNTEYACLEFNYLI